MTHRRKKASAISPSRSLITAWQASRTADMRQSVFSWTSDFLSLLLFTSLMYPFFFELTILWSPKGLAKGASLDSDPQMFYFYIYIFICSAPVS